MTAKSRPSSAVLWLIALLLLAGVASAFFAGYLPREKRVAAITKETRIENDTAPVVNVTTVERSTGKTDLVLSGNIQPLAEAPVLARATGYVKKRFADIGDRVTEGQVLAEIDAIEMEHQVAQAKAVVEQTNAALEQSNANLVQGRTTEKLQKTTAERWANLVQRGAVSRQENDTYQAQYEAQQATVQALEKAVNVAKSNIAAAQANLARLNEMQGYLKVRAPFSGIVTQRNVDVGALANEGSTLLFRIAQIDRLRVYVNVPQADAASMRTGMTAKIVIPDIPREQFSGTVTRSSNSLDAASRTMLTEVQVPNRNNLLLPGMYAQVSFSTPRAEPPLLIRGDALVIRSSGPQVALVTPGKTVHFTKVQLGRDYGDKIEVLSGLDQGQQAIVNPGDAIQEGAKVNPRK